MTQTVPYFDTFPELFDRFTGIWDGISTDFDDWILAALPALAGSGVDLGCGAGRHSVLTRERFHRAYGEVFPGAVFNDRLGPVMCGLVWTAPA